MANIVMEVFFFFVCEFSVSISWACIKLKYGSHAIYVHKIRTAVCIYVFAVAFNITTLVQPASVAQLDARPTGDQEVAGSTPAEVGNILSWRLIMKYFLRSFSPFR